MAKGYKKHHNAGPVPHPDQSGKFLQEGEVVYGDEWEPFVALDYVVPVDDGEAPAPPKAPEKPAPKAVEPPPVEPSPVVSEEEQGDMPQFKDAREAQAQTRRKKKSTEENNG